ncbi:MAG: DUF5916 domain-containing protein [Bacteroidales bacterium]|nr:DUF5916 domain-containing protein [Bacteroidales bacterium]MDZ4203901.1 DUF5916 domain-containing protein [Bacteroidales bacterium]
MRQLFYPTLLLLLPFLANAASPPNTATVTRTPASPTIDGQLSDAVWLLADPVSEFWQTDPVFMKAPSQATEVRILYDNLGLYIGARMFDTSPDSILTQLGNRDDNLNADLFGLQFDTYNNGLDAFIFEVHASGVQRDGRITDKTFNAVWESAVVLDAKGWTAEIHIPWSALRFPDNGKQIWKMQLSRTIRRHRETLQWAPEPKGAVNRLNYWGQLVGLSNIEPPVRLSLSPYLSTHVEHYPYNTPGSSNYSTTFSGGADLKYGITKSFTADMTLLPDFSTVASDHEIKNLTAFETVYDEKREFFKEGMDLFLKGNLFYTRRIGRRPRYYYSVHDMIDHDATVLRNPDRAQLINATKLSGRTSSNTGIGIFNALVGNVYATYEDSLGHHHRILTEPMTNYNIAVVDQGLNFNSSAYLINTNVTCAHGFNNENVTGAGITYVGKSNTYRFDARGSLSQLYQKSSFETPKAVNLGYRYNLGFTKIKGKLQYHLWYTAMDAGYNINALGLNRKNDEINNGAKLSYNIYEPFWKLLRFSLNTTLDNSNRLSDGLITGLLWSTMMHLTTRDHFSFWTFFATDLREKHDFYEPRTAGRFYLAPKFTGGDLNFSSDYRKPFALNGEIELARNNDSYKEISLELEPIIRFSDKWTLQHQVKWTNQENDKGFASKISSTEIIFGNRDLRTLENAFSSRYIFRNNLSLSLWMRHYWFRGEYDGFYDLNQQGRLEAKPLYSINHDFNFNTFNIDFKLEWEFAPGSNLSVVYKNAIIHEEDRVMKHFIDNWQGVMSAPQLNSLTFRLLYYIDYQSLVSRKTT